MFEKGKSEAILGALLAILLVTTFINTAFASTGNIAFNENKRSPQTYVGVTFGGNTTNEAKLLIDRVKSYTNLFVIQSGPVSKNQTAMTEISQYTIEAGLSLLVYFGYLDTQNPWQLPWSISAKQKWGDKFLGVYLDDEPGGVPLDYNWTGFFNSQKQLNSSVYQSHAFAIDGLLNGTYPHDHDEAATLLQSAIAENLAPLKNSSLTAFTSDYALYWFDYKGGYDVMLTQLGYNESITQNMALIRGAARMQNKEWGSIITWKYTQPPYLGSGQEIYKQMLTSFQAGAKYIILFNYPQIPGNNYGTLQVEHFEALQKFWRTINSADTHSLPDFSQANIALVLPANYGFGLRSPNDRIWGYWGPDEKSAPIWNITQRLISTYGLDLDIVYDDSAFPIDRQYSEIYYWNQTIPRQTLQSSYSDMSNGCPKSTD